MVRMSETKDVAMTYVLYLLYVYREIPIYSCQVPPAIKKLK